MNKRKLRLFFRLLLGAILCCLALGCGSSQFSPSSQEQPQMTVEPHFVEEQQVTAVSPQRIVCPDCGSSGLCPICNGSQTVIRDCAFCLGRGYEPQDAGMAWMDAVVNATKNNVSIDTGSVREWVTCHICQGSGKVQTQCLKLPKFSTSFVLCLGRCELCLGQGNIDANVSGERRSTPMSYQSWQSMEIRRIQNQETREKEWNDVMVQPYAPRREADENWWNH